MKKYKILGVLSVLFVMFSVVHVDAFTLKQVVEQAETLSGATVATNPDYNQDDINGQIVVSASGMTLTGNYNSSTKELSFTSASGEATGNEDTILVTLLDAIASLHNLSTDGASIKNTIKTEPTKYTYDKCGIEGTIGSSGRFATLRVNTDNFDLNCKLSAASNNTNKDSSTATTNANVKNPKTGVFVPVAGLSLLIVASVVCLV